MSGSAAPLFCSSWPQQYWLDTCSCLRQTLAGELAGWLAWFVGALFVPALALALGVWFGNSRAFEAIYLLLWYIGLIEQVPALDYAGATAGGLEMGMPLVYLGISAGLVALALIGRGQQIRA
jgi:hypothetical protein